MYCENLIPNNHYKGFQLDTIQTIEEVQEE